MLLSYSRCSEAKKAPRQEGKEKTPVSHFIIFPVEATQVSRPFQNVNENETSLDIPNKLTKITSEPLLIPFTYIYNQSIANHIVPDLFKISRVTPIYKSGEVTDTGELQTYCHTFPLAKF